MSFYRRKNVHSAAIMMVILLAAAGFSKASILAQGTRLSESGQDFVQVYRLADGERGFAYLQMTFQTDGWTAGKVINKKPYSVVVRDDLSAANTDAVYRLQIWRGIAARMENNLFTEWDVLELNSKGRVVRVTEGCQRALEGYFQATSQRDLQTMEDVTRYPWANLPTDSEAQAVHIRPIPSDGSIDVYGILPRDGSITLSEWTAKVKPLLAIPKQVLDQTPTWWQASPDLELSPVIPADAASHWARDYIMNLMKRSILVGYENQTVHPDAAMTRAQFMAMLVRAMDLDGIRTPNEGFADMSGHWAEHEVNIALESGLVEPAVSFNPETPISRLETVQIVAKVVQTLPVTYKQAEPVPVHAASTSSSSSLAPAVPLWDDLPPLSPEAADGLALLAVEGLISSDTDSGSKFRPNASLTRAEASKLISLLLKFMQREK